MIRLQTNQPSNASNVVRLAIESMFAPTAVQIGALARLLGVEANIQEQNHRRMDLLPKISVFIALDTRTLLGKHVTLGPVLH